MVLLSWDIAGQLDRLRNPTADRFDSIDLFGQRSSRNAIINRKCAEHLPGLIEYWR